jgi:hypothetical protein
LPYRVEDRRAHEQDLLRGYLAERRKAAVPVPNWNQAWESYRQHPLHGLLYAMVPHEMQPADVCEVLSDRYAQAVLDHDTYRLLGV